MKDEHPFSPFVNFAPKKLIIGTIPPHRFCVNKIYDDDVNFYYGSRNNYFWKLIADIFSSSFSFKNTDNAILERKKFLKVQKIGITDIVNKCNRKNNGSSDNDLYSIEPKSIKCILKKQSSINELIYTSDFVKYFINDEFNTFHSIDKTNKKHQSIIIDGKKYIVNILYSPSPQALRNMGEDGAKKRKKQYEQVFS